MKLTMLGREKNYAGPVEVMQVIRDLAPEYEKRALGLFCGGRALELNQQVGEDASLHPITFQNEEGRRIYERSLRFVLLLAVQRALGKEYHVRIEHSIGYGVYLRLLEKEVTESVVVSLEGEMRKIVRENLPFTREMWTREEAIRYFGEQGLKEKAHLLSFRPYDYFPVYRCGGMAEYFYGAMLPSTGYVPVFRLKYHAPGFVMQMPSPQDEQNPAPFARREKHLAVFAQSMLMVPVTWITGLPAQKPSWKP